LGEAAPIVSQSGKKWENLHSSGMLVGK